VKLNENAGRRAHLSTFPKVVVARFAPLGGEESARSMGKMMVGMRVVPSAHYFIHAWPLYYYYHYAEKRPLIAVGTFKIKFISVSLGVVLATSRLMLARFVLLLLFSPVSCKFGTDPQETQNSKQPKINARIETLHLENLTHSK